VVFDLQAAQSLAHGSRGIARYAVEHAAAFSRIAPDAVRAFLVNPRFLLPPSTDRFLGSGRLAWSTPDADALRSGPMFFHVMSPFELGVPLEELWPPAVRRPDVRLAVTLYDLIPLLFPDPYLADQATRGRYMARLQMLRAADLVLAISESTRQDAIRHLGLRPERVRVIDAGVADDFRPPEGDRRAAAESLSRRLPGLRPGYHLYTGGVDFRKNMEALIRAHAGLPRDVRARHQLVIVCRMSDTDRARYLGVAAEAGNADDVLLTGFVPDHILRELYQAADLFVFPSVYEGSGLPVIEAVACGAPVIASNSSSLPEVTPSPEALFDPGDIGSITAMMLRAGEDGVFRQRLLRASAEAAGRHTWERTARLTLDAMGERWDARPARPRRRARIAVTTPYPPDPSGIAEYSRGLLAALAESCDVDCYVGGDPAGYDAPPHPACRLFDVEALPARARLIAYDGVIHCMGNNPIHEFVMDAAAAVPGAILCHDTRLVRYYSGASRDLAASLREMYAHRLPPVLDREDVDHEAVERAGVWMLGEVVTRARGVMVHSRLAAEVVRLEAEAHGVALDVSVVPFGCPPHAPSDSAALPALDGALVASFGLVDPVKRPDVLIAALPAIRATCPGARLALVGPVGDGYREDLSALAASAGVGDAVTITGAVPRDEYAAWLDAADVAVQLRSMTQGEASLTVAETLAAAVPTIVTDAGWMGELPEGNVLRLPADAGVLSVADAVCRTLGDPALAGELRDAGRAWAGEHSFREVAAALRAAAVAA
jgi:glycosyltransferase involved in cell wall biosynthesis